MGLKLGRIYADVPIALPFRRSSTVADIELFPTMAIVRRMEGEMRDRLGSEWPR